MNTHQFTLQTNKNHRIACSTYSQTSAPKAIVLLLHGMGEYSACYDFWASLFSQNNYLFFIYDQRGHGKSSGKRGVAYLDDLLADLQAVIAHIQSAFPNLPLVIFGHSMGGQLALRYSFTPDCPAKALILSAPWLKLERKLSKSRSLLVNIFSRIFPALTIKTGLRAADLSSDSSRLPSTKTDPLLHKLISLKTFADLQRNAAYCLTHPQLVSRPTLILHGTADPVASFSASQDFAKNSPQITFSPWDNNRHNLLNDSDTPHIANRILQFLSHTLH